MKIVAIVCLILAGLTGLVAINNVFIAGENRPEESARLAGYIVGSFLVPIVLLIIGLVIWKKAGSGR